MLAALGLGAQGALLNVPPMALYSLIAVQIAGGDLALADWMVFSSLAALVFFSGLFGLIIALRLSVLRHIFTPTAN